MKIYGNKPEGQQEIKRPVQSGERSEIKSKSVSGPVKAQTDKVEISTTGKEVAELMSAIDRMPEVREEKVAAIQDALSTGAYSVDPRKIAEKILKEL